MTKKRFIKMVMSYGIQRNEAEVWACLVNNYESYKSLLSKFHTHFAARKFIGDLQKAIISIEKQIPPIVKTLASAFAIK